MARVVFEVRFASGQAQTLEFSKNVLSIGREVGDIVLGDPGVSSRHGEVRLSTTEVTFVDLGSTNGTFLENGQRVSQHAWPVGGSLRLGGVWLKLTVAELAPKFGPAGTMVIQQTTPEQLGQAVPAPPRPAAAQFHQPAAQPAAGAPQFHGAGAAVPAPGQFQPPIQQQAGPAPGIASGPAFPGAQQAQPHSPQPAGGAAPATPGGGFAPGPEGGFAPGAPALGVGGGPVAAAGMTPYQAGPSPALAADPDQGMGSFLKACWDDYQPHLIEGFLTLAYITVIPALLVALASFVFSLGGLLVMLLLWPVQVLLMLFVGIGAYHEFALRLAIGAPIKHGQALRIQLGRMFSFFLGILVPTLLAAIGLMFCVVPGVLFGWYLFPVYMIEGKSSPDNNMRSFELLKANWNYAVTLVVAAVGVWLVVYVPTIILGFLPVIGVFAGVLAAAGYAAALPFLALIHFRLYFAVRRQVDGDAALEQQLQPYRTSA